MPDFSSYSLAVFFHDQMIFSSSDKGLRPLWNFLCGYCGKDHNLVLHDKVIGLAAARLAVYSGIFTEIQTNLVSLPAKIFLEDNGITLLARDITDRIMNRDRSSVCPGEIIALNHPKRHDFYAGIRSLMDKSLERDENKEVDLRTM